MTRFFRRGTSEIKFATAVEDINAVERSEITAAEDLTPQVADISGFSLSNSPIPTPDLKDTFTSQIDGEDTVADSTITFYDDDTASAIRDALAKGTEGYILLFPYGDVATKRMEAWHVKSTGVNDEWSVGNDPARFVVGFAVLERPQQDIDVPANP